MALYQIADNREDRVVGGVALIIITGLVLGLSYNYFGLNSTRRWGLKWIAEDRMAELEKVATVQALPATETETADPYLTDVTDPLAVGSTVTGQAALPEIPAIGRPVQIELGALKQYVDANAALIVDAREPGEYDAGHIPGAVNLPFDEAISDPTRVETLVTAGRPVIAYCGGGTCELSVSLAYELLASGHERVAVYMGGYPEWVEAGHAVEKTARGTER